MNAATVIKQTKRRVQRMTSMPSSSSRTTQSKTNDERAKKNPVSSMKDEKSSKTDKFKPKRDPRMERLLGKIASDQDIWVERYFLTRDDDRVYYFRSVRTNRAVLMEPPTGSSVVVTRKEIKHYPELIEFATEPLDRPLSDIEKPLYFGKTYKERRAEKKKQSMKK